jgi:hypothetical protein
MFGWVSKRALVVLTVDTKSRAMDVGEARHIAFMILEAAEAAESDQVAFEWLKYLFGDDAQDEQTGRMLLDFRKLRATIRQRERLGLEQGGDQARNDLLSRAEMILSALSISWDMKPIDATAHADVREYLMTQIARAKSCSG